jgi:hypothetical protein
VYTLTPVALWPAKAGHEPFIDWIGAANEKNRNRLGRVLRHERRRCTSGRNNDGHVTANQICCLLPQPIEITLCPTVFNRDVSTFDITAGVEAPVECSHEAGECAERRDIKEPDHRHCRLLRVRRKRPCGCYAAKRDDKFSPSDLDCHASLPPEVVCMQ